jgi:hypothetical protein
VHAGHFVQVHRDQADSALQHQKHDQPSCEHTKGQRNKIGHLPADIGIEQT